MDINSFRILLVDMKVIQIGVVSGILLLLIFSSVGTGFSVEQFNGEKKTEFCFSDPIVLVTGFGPFGGHEVNPAQIIAENLSGQMINGATIVGIIVPVNYTTSVEVVTQAIEDYNPVLVVSLGLAAGYPRIFIEKVGLNLRRFGNHSCKWLNFRRLDPNGPWFRISPFPTYSIVKNIRRAGIPAQSSLYAGIYQCNALLYGVLGYIKENDLQIKSGFIHVPLLSSQDPNGMELEKMLEATKIAIQVCLNN